MALKIQSHVEALSEDAKAYLEALIDYYKLDAYKKSAKATSALLQFIVVSGIFLLFFAFLSIALAILIGDLIGIMYVGFFIVSAINLILVFFFLSNGKKLIDRFVLKVFGEIFASEEDESQKTE